MKKIHITESQLNYIRQKLTEIVNQEVSKEIEQGKTPQQISTEFSQKNPNIPRDEVNFTFNQASMDEGVEEVWDKNVDRDSTEYYQVKDYLESLVGTPQYFSIVGGANGTNLDMSRAMDDVQSYFGGAINRDVIFAALKDFRDEKVRSMEMGENPYDNVMEGRRFTKKQIKEAKIRNLRENSIRITKRSLK